MASYRTSKSFGERHEYLAISELLKKGYDVYKTLVDDQGIDCIIRKSIVSNPVYIDLQIKARSNECEPKNAARFADMEIRDPRENYLFLFYSEWLETTWIIPSLDLVRIASKNKNGSRVGKYHILLSGTSKSLPTKNNKFQMYEDKNGFKIIDDTFDKLSRAPLKQPAP